MEGTDVLDVSAGEDEEVVLPVSGASQGVRERPAVPFRVLDDPVSRVERGGAQSCALAGAGKRRAGVGREGS